MTKLLPRLLCLFLVLILTVATAVLPDSGLALATTLDRFPSTVIIKSNDGEKQQITYCRTLIAAIDEAGIVLGDNDRLSLPEDTVLLPGQKYEVSVCRLDQVNLTWSGYALATSGEFYTLGDLLSRSGYSSLDLSDGSRIENNGKYDLNFVSVDKKTVRNYETIPYSSITIDDPTIYEGKTVIAVAGQNGTRALIFEETYENGIFISSVQVGSEVVKEPVQEVIHHGTKPRLNYTPFNPKTLTRTVSSNLSKIKGYLNPQGNKSYSTYKDNGDGTLTIDGVTFNFKSMKKRTITMYDGLECCLQAHDHSPAINHNTFSGVPAQRGIVATLGVKSNGDYVGSVLPMGTIVFIVGYGLGVVGDVHGAKDNPDMIDACYNAGEIRSGVATLGKISSKVYILDIP
jgi:uncharacterized protein YabE (DUF348 family)/3D (Asp-Asp-Asp) domain-containing protein